MDLRIDLELTYQLHCTFLLGLWYNEGSLKGKEAYAISGGPEDPAAYVARAGAVGRGFPKDYQLHRAREEYAGTLYHPEVVGLSGGGSDVD
jgi:hypothetical protein